MARRKAAPIRPSLSVAEQDRIILELWDAGMSADAIAAQLSLCPGAVADSVDDFGEPQDTPCVQFFGYSSFRPLALIAELAGAEDYL